MTQKLTRENPYMKFHADILSHNLSKEKFKFCKKLTGVYKSTVTTVFKNETVVHEVPVLVPGQL